MFCSVLNKCIDKSYIKLELTCDRLHFVFSFDFDRYGRQCAIAAFFAPCPL